MNLTLLFWLLLKASLFSTGGMGNAPILHADLRARGWAPESQFGQAFSVGQFAPGPNGLWVISLGYFVAGVRGALLALVAICLPPLFVLAASKLYQRVKHHPYVEGFVHGFGLAVVGIFVVVLARVLSSVGLEARSLLVLAASMALGLQRRLPILVILCAAGLAGLLFR